MNYSVGRSISDTLKYALTKTVRVYNDLCKKHPGKMILATATAEGLLGAYIGDKLLPTGLKIGSWGPYPAVSELFPEVNTTVGAYFGSQLGALAGLLTPLLTGSLDKKGEEKCLQ